MAKVFYIIKAKHKNQRAAEEIDDTETEDDAHYLANEYRKAFGPNYVIYFTRRQKRRARR